MRTQVVAGAVLAGIFLTVTPATAATFNVSPGGSDAGSCGTHAAPCRTLQRAINRANDGDTILLTEPGDYGPGVVVDSVNILAVPGAGVFSPTTSCLVFNGASTAVLNVTDLTCNMDRAPADGIVLNSGHKMRLENVRVRNLVGSRCGARVKPSSGNTELQVRNSTFSEIGTTGTNTGGGICILPTGTGQVSGVLRNNTIQNNRHGVVSSAAGSAGSNVLIDNSDLSANAGGIFSVGANSTLCVRNSTVSGNTFQGLGGGGALLNGGNNLIWNNATDGMFTGNCP
jgi:hypothetical protein